MRILVADDEPITLNLIALNLKNWGYETLLAENGMEAFEILKKENISLLVSDWMMPEMNGVDLCRAIRNADLPYYVYIIMLTAKSDKKALINGMKAGADDYMVKPFNRDELHVRINAGVRVLNLERDLARKNESLEKASTIIQKDLKAAAKLQKALLPSTSSDINGVRFDWSFLPCTYVAGDIFNYFKLDDQKIGFYLLDVAGHGIPSAMLSFTLSNIISPSAIGEDGNSENSLRQKMFSPALAMKELNMRFQGDVDSMLYFTMIYGVIDASNNTIKLAQAGHPSPVLIRSNGETELIGDGGVPIGMFVDLEYEEIEVEFRKGDRLFIYSDGITECSNAEKKQYSERRLVSNLQKWRKKSLSELLTELNTSLHDWRADNKFDDDVSLMAIEHIGT